MLISKKAAKKKRNKAETAETTQEWHAAKVTVQTQKVCVRSKLVDSDGI